MLLRRYAQGLKSELTLKLSRKPRIGVISVLTLDHMQCKKLADMIKRDIDAYCVVAYSDAHREHLGASIIGDDCRRRLWYIFRWAKTPDSAKDGRMQRLFNRGHREEERFIEWLVGIGAKVWALDENGKQYRISGVDGHFGGSLDSFVSLPEQYNRELGIPPETQLLVLGEFKTSATGSGFTLSVERGMQFAKPKHFNQMSTYGRRYELRYGVYFIINKNDDSLHVQVVELDWKLGEDNLKKAESIINSPTAPPRISETPAFKECKYCDFVGICHHGEVPEQNCRSCCSAQPVANGEWFCHRYQQIIPAEYIKQGCAMWARIQ